MQMEDLDGFFLTKGLATPALRAKVEELRDEIHKLEQAYQAEYVQFIATQSDLAKMEQKSQFVQNALEKTLAILSPPEEGEMERVYDTLERYVHDPLEYVSTGMMGAGSLIFLVGKIGGRSTTQAGAAIGKKGLIKPGAKLGKSMKALSRTRSASRAAGAVTKATKWTKVARVGSKLGAIGLVVAAVDFGLSLATAAEMNAFFKKQAVQMKGNIAQANAQIEELKGQVAQGQAAIAQILSDSGVTTVDEFVKQMNEAIADLGQKSANISVARRMLLDGFIPADRILNYVPALTEEVIRELRQKLDAEHRLLEGAAPAQAADATGLGLARVQVIARLQRARVALLDGDTIAEAATAADMPENLVAGEDETLQGDLQALWPQIDALAPASAIARMILTPASAVEQLYVQLKAKQRLYEGADPHSVAAEVGISADKAQNWAEDLASARENIAVLAAGPRRMMSDTEMAADFLLPLALVEAVSTRIAA